jgi:phosphatidylglycerophosphatase A
MNAIRSIAVAFATGLGAGLSPVAPGTCGTLLAVPLFRLLSSMPPWMYGVTLCGITALGTWSAGIAGRVWNKTDDQRIVIDEVAGYLLTMALTTPTWPHLAAGFALFRFFDILKPWPVGWADKTVKNAFGVMLDDLLAGVYGFIVLRLLNAYL